MGLIRDRYAEPLPTERLAEAAGMSASSFHQHFKAVTSLSPLQFQKQLRLIEARRMVVSEGAPISNAALPPFTCKYGRMFGAPPARDLRSNSAGIHVAG